VLVICHGNICRSPFAAALLARALPDREVRSAGLLAGEGNPADPTALRVARIWDVDLAAHRTRPIAAADVGWADLILGMEGHHAAALERGFPDAGSKSRLLGHFLPSPPYAIADPWGLSESVFEETFERIALAAERLAAIARESRA
jgi:protein-tyrosine phosphatase